MPFRSMMFPRRASTSSCASLAENDLPALREHHVEVELVREPLPELQRKLEKLSVAVHHVIRTYDCRIAPDIARTNIRTLEHRDIA